MKILHLTDFHFESKLKSIQKTHKMVDNLIKSLSDCKPDLILFTGDLVQKGDSVEDFLKAKELLLDKIITELKIEKTNLLICPGNHDVFRNQELPDIAESIVRINSNDLLDEYVVKNNKRSLNASLENLKNYNDFSDSFYLDHKIKCEDNIIDGMFSTHIRVIDGVVIGICLINSAWRCIDSKSDYGNLKYPVYYLNEAIQKLKNCEFKIFGMHHPLSDFAFWNSWDLEDLIYKEFHMMFTGHTHKKKDTLQLIGGVGIYHCSSSATLSLSNEGNIGYSIVTTDLDSYQLDIDKFHFVKEIERFVHENTIHSEIPVDEEKKKLNRLRTLFKKRFKEKSEEADDLFLSYKEIKTNNFLELFSEPILKSQSEFNQKKESSKSFSILDFIKESKDYLIIGRDKSGKSAILYKILLESLSNFKKHEVIPLYINCNNFNNVLYKLDIPNILRDFIELNQRESLELLKEYKLLLLLDNFNDEELIQKVCDFKNNNKNVYLIASTSETLYNTFSINWNTTTGFTNVYIHDITRDEIRSLTNKWPNISQKNREVILEKIHKLFAQLSIPSNYWTVSLFIWLFEKNSNLNFSNNFQLIELYIDNLLDKDNFVLNYKRNKIDYEDLKAYLGELAHFLVKEKYEKNYLMSYKDWVDFTSDYKNRNKRFVADDQKIIELLQEKGIIKKELTGVFSFRLNGVFEYFIGYYMSIDEMFRKSIISDDHFYLSFGNELEICSGFDSYNDRFVKDVYDKTSGIFNDLNSQYDINRLDSVLVSKIDSRFHISDGFSNNIRKGLSMPMSPEKQDEIYKISETNSDNTGSVKKKKFYDWIEPNVDNYEKALFILGRVFRNSKLRNNDLNNEVFDFLLSSTCTLAFALIDEIEGKQFDESKTSEEELVKLITKFVPIMAQTYFNDAVVQGNLEVILIDKINELKGNPQGNEFKLLILYYSLIDLDLSGHVNYIKEVIELLSIPVLKSSSVLKLYLYLSLKVNGNKELQKKIEGLIREQEKKIDSNRERMGQIESKIAKVKIAKPNK